MITQEQLKQFVYYSPESGIFTWIHKLNQHEVGDTLSRKTDSGYGIVMINRETYRLHRLAFLYMTGSFPTYYVDHKDGNKSNNTWTNLRQCTKSENGLNVGIRSNNTSGCKGVSWRADRNKWRVYLRVQGKITNLGNYEDYNLAELVATEARNKYHGEFARHD